MLLIVAKIKWHIGLLGPRGENRQRPSALCDDQPFPGADATQVPAEILPQLTDSHTIAHAFNVAQL